MHLSYLIFLITISLYSVAGLKCYNGISDLNENKTQLSLIECNSSVRFCAKITSEGISQIIHSCANNVTCPEKGCTFDAATKHCCCEQDNCNSSTFLRFENFIIAFTVVLVF